MAGGTVSDPWVAQVMEGRRRAAGDTGSGPGTGVTFQTLQMHLGAVEQARICRTVRFVTGAAAFLPDRCVLKHERAALISVTLVAAGLIGTHRGLMRSEGPAVRIMAVVAADRAVG